MADLRERCQQRAIRSLYLAAFRGWACMCSRCTADDRAYWAPHREQSRRAGPALFGSIRLVKSEAACLYG